MTTSWKDKKLARGKDRKVLGVCSGIGEYLGIDPVLIRVLWILVLVFTGIFPGLLVYLLMAWVMPERG